MKGEFIPKFINALAGGGKVLYDIFRRESFYYKDLRIGGYDPVRLHKSFNNLRYRGLIHPLSDNQFKFTDKGRKWLGGVLLKYYKFAGYNWDHKWRVIIFDIPQELHQKRNRFRAKLKTLGFYMIQKSVFVFPYPCEDEVARYCGQLKVNDYINILTAEKLGYVDHEVRKFYNL
ncbi:MAG: CRISPR-associated endonuclease Cas2 [Candidatus Yanofskybacteria bacterium]|nr:CRISPR-associated endonuclease Cas2 [Candidatus Yanofskybacteria bacterium]